MAIATQLGQIDAEDKVVLLEIKKIEGGGKIWKTDV